MSGKEWSSLIQRLLYAFEWDLEDLAEACGVHPSTVGRWVDDEVVPRRKSRMRVIKLFDCTSFEDLLERVNEKERQQRIARVSEVSEPTVSDSELDQIVALVYLVMEPGPARQELIQRVPFLKKLATEGKSILESQFKPVAAELRENLEIIQEGAP